MAFMQNTNAMCVDFFIGTILRKKGNQYGDCLYETPFRAGNPPHYPVEMRRLSI